MRLRHSLALSLYAILLSICAAMPAIAAGPAVCYGILDTGGCDAPNVAVPAASGAVALPADFEVQTDRSVTLVVSISTAQFVGPPSIVGGTVLGSGPQSVIASCSGGCVLALPKVLGLTPGNSLVSSVRLFDPNGPTQELFNGQFTLATMTPGVIPDPEPGAFTATIWTINPASNTEQRTFVRIVAPQDAAQVVIYATDDSGARKGPVFVHVPAGGAIQVTAADIENGNPAKGIVGIGRGVGKWVFRLESDTPFRAFGLGVGLSSLPTE